MCKPLRALFVEDDFLLSETLRDGLESLGCLVVAQASNLSDGLQIAAQCDCDFAVVDLDLGGEMAFPLLDALRERGTPFVMATGAFLDEIPPRFCNSRRLAKPFSLQELREAIADFHSRGSVSSNQTKRRP